MRHSFILAVLAFSLFLAEAPLFSQSPPKRAVLDSGPVREKGLLFLPINVIDHYRGVYTIDESRITVFYTEYEMEPFQSWTDYPCSSRSLLLVEQNDRFSTLFLVHRESWQLFVQFPAGFSGECEFIDAFVRRFLYFKQVNKTDGVPPFPAILALQ